jgi:hypoxanthine-DNA glycosylase
MNDDMLIVYIDHEQKSFKKQYTFSGKNLAHKDSISFRVSELAGQIIIRWSGVLPLEEGGVPTGEFKQSPKPIVIRSKPKDGKIESLKAISDKLSSVLILGTMPGKESLSQQAYYSHPRNLFWVFLKAITHDIVPDSSEEREAYLIKHRIAVWDICQSCFREGSLDQNISEELPNDIKQFIAQHPNIKTIAFNGKKAAQLFAKHIGNVSGIRLLSLPSSSPANAGISMEAKLEQWQRIKEY